MSKIIYEGKSSAVVKYFDDYLIIPIQHKNDEKAIAHFYANGCKKVPIDRAIDLWCELFLER